MAGRGQNFQQVRNLRPGKSLFDLSYNKKFTCDMGQLIPVQCDEVVPGDVVKMGCEAVIRFNPMVVPVLHKIDAFFHTFFVPYDRVLDPNFQSYITGYNKDDTREEYVGTIPTWTPTNTAIGSLWDYLGFPVGVNPVGAYPIDYPRRAYNKIFNEYYRDENLMDEVALTNESILRRCWQKDYFTSALPWQQKGVSPALPIAGTTAALWNSNSFTELSGDPGIMRANGSSGANAKIGGTTAQFTTTIRDFFAKNTVDLSVASTFDIADLRIAFQIQKWMERNARCGSRYTEFLQSHFGISPKDERLQRPEYIGGHKAPVIVSEVLQTSETETTPQGNLAGHGLCVGRGYIGDYHVQEYGLIMTLMSVMPVTAYEQGIDRQWIKRSKYDFFFPEFVNLSEQAIERCEIYANGVEADNRTLFGYQGRYDEMRTKRDMVCGQMRMSGSLPFPAWTLGRQFSAPPILNQSFLTCNPRKDIFAAPNEPALVVNYGNIMNVYRPLPVIAEPGLIDHI